MEEFYPFFLIIFAGVLFSMVFRRMHVPWVVGLILGGILVGPHGFHVIKITPIAEFVGQIGLVFLMFMAGLETRVGDFKGFQKKLGWLSFVNGFIPFAVGFILTLLFGYSVTSALLVGIIFVSSSIAIVVPALEQNNLIKTKLGQSIVITSVIQDIASLVLLSIVLQSISPVTNLPLLIFYPTVFVILLFLKWALPKIMRFFTKSLSENLDFFQQEFRAIFFILLGTVIAFELLGLHPIIAGFFTGLVLADAIKSNILKEKIRTISYGIFIPTFFILVGTQTNAGVIFESKEAIFIIGAIVFGSMLSKFVSGWLGGKLVGFTNNQSLLFGVSSMPQLSTTLAVASTALTLGLIDQKLIAAMVSLSIVTVIVSPTLMNRLGKKIQDTEMVSSG